MPFPSVGDSWPPAEWVPAFAQFEQNAAWYVGDQSKLQTLYGKDAGTGSRGDNEATHYNKGDGTARRGGVRGWLYQFFNGRIVQADQQQTRLHAPIAGNLATLSSDLLFAEAPNFRLYGEDGDALPDEQQARIDKILNGDATRRALLAGGEDTAGIGASVLTAHWDPAVTDAPWLQITACDAVIPEFVAGRLTAVNLYTTYPIPNSMGIIDVVRVHIERHESGVITHALAELTAAGKIAKYVPLDTIGPTAHLLNIRGARIPDAQDYQHVRELPTGISRLTAAWWRNAPTKQFRNFGQLAMIGRADFEGVEPFLDSADETWSSWMRDIKIARARLIVPEAYLDIDGPGLGGKFDTDREILTGLAVTNLSGEDSKITAHQFKIRAEEHAATLLAITREVTQKAGYSLSSYGERGDTSGVTATEITDRTTMTERTRDKKALYFREAAVPLALALLELDRVHYRQPAGPEAAEVRVDFTELSQIDPEKEARVFQYLRAAMAVSTDTIVRERNPDWDQDQIDEEVAKIVRENGLPGADEVDDPARVGRVAPTDPTDPARDNGPDPEDPPA